MSLRVRRMSRQPDEIARAATLRHAAFFAGTDRSIAEDAAGLARLVAEAVPPEAAFVAELDGALAGTCLLVREELSQRHELGPWLAGLVVDPACRGRGVGAALVGAVVDHGRSEGVARLFLYTDEAEGFYAAYGWTVCDRFADAAGIPSALMAIDPAPRDEP